eukprot:444827_1
MNIKTAKENPQNINIRMQMYTHSEKLTIAHPIYENVNLICSPQNETHFIEIDMNNKVTEEKIFELSQAEYDGGQFPCDGIHIDCTQSDNRPKSCDVEYELNTLSFFELEGYLHDNRDRKNAQDIQCYWMYVEQLYKIQCGSGKTCNQNNIAKEFSALISKDALAVIISVCVLLVLVIIILIRKLYKDNKAESNAIPMENPMVVSLAIGDYSNPPKNREVTDEFESLKVDIDVQTLLTLCDSKHLNYTVYPKYENDENIKVRWTHDELKKYLKQYAHVLECDLEQKEKEEKEQQQQQEQEQEQEQKQKKKERNSTRLNSSHESQ